MKKKQSNYEFNTNDCMAQYSMDEITNCLSETEVFIFCPFVIFFGAGRFCCNPQKSGIVAQTNALSFSPKSTENSTSRLAQNRSLA
jgi:hypothetical protein